MLAVVLSQSRLPERLYPNKKKYQATDTKPQLPHEITEGKFIDTIIDQADIDFSQIDYWAVRDSHGRVHSYKRRHGSNTGNQSSNAS